MQYKYYEKIGNSGFLSPTFISAEGRMQGIYCHPSLELKEKELYELGKDFILKYNGDIQMAYPVLPQRRGDLKWRLITALTWFLIWAAVMTIILIICIRFISFELFN